jgi:hypothetical protein
MLNHVHNKAQSAIKKEPSHASTIEITVTDFKIKTAIKFSVIHICKRKESCSRHKMHL